MTGFRNDNVGNKPLLTAEYWTGNEDEILLTPYPFLPPFPGACSEGTETYSQRGLWSQKRKWRFGFGVLRFLREDFTEEMTLDLCLRGVCYSMNDRVGKVTVQEETQRAKSLCTDVPERVSHLRCWSIGAWAMVIENAQIIWTTTHRRIVLLPLNASLKSCSVPPVEYSTHQCSFSYNLSRVNTTSTFFCKLVILT